MSCCLGHPRLGITRTHVGWTKILPMSKLGTLSIMWLGRLWVELPLRHLKPRRWGHHSSHWRKSEISCNWTPCHKKTPLDYISFCQPLTTNTEILPRFLNSENRNPFCTTLKSLAICHLIP